MLDDHSRLACHVQWYWHEDSESLCHGLMPAIMKRGLPRRQMSDNGAAMKAEETRSGLAPRASRRPFAVLLVVARKASLRMASTPGRLHQLPARRDHAP